MAREYAYGSSRQSVDLGPGNERLEVVAQDVAMARGRVVVEVACHIAAIRSLQKEARYGSGATVSCVKAKVQDTKGGSGHQAAHLLPGQIMIGGQPVWLRADGKLVDHSLQQDVLRLEFRTITAFAETKVLPAAFNRADSQAERISAASGVLGLTHLFGQSMGRLWTTARTDPKRPMCIDQKAVMAALEFYFSSAKEVYAAACRQKRQAGAVAGRRGNPAAEDRRELEARVLETYHSSLSVVAGGGFIRSHMGLMYPYEKTI
ncbi:MAG: hypothetical protein R3C59_10085 [Planctomycetaceae bacterium]